MQISKHMNKIKLKITKQNKKLEGGFILNKFIVIEQSDKNFKNVMEF